MTAPLSASRNLSRLQSKARQGLKLKWYEVTSKSSTLKDVLDVLVTLLPGPDMMLRGRGSNHRYHKNETKNPQQNEMVPFRKHSYFFILDLFVNTLAVGEGGNPNDSFKFSI